MDNNHEEFMNKFDGTNKMVIEKISDIRRDWDSLLMANLIDDKVHKKAVSLCAKEIKRIEEKND